MFIVIMYYKNIVQGFPSFLGKLPQMDIMNILQSQALITLHFYSRFII